MAVVEAGFFFYFVLFITLLCCISSWKSGKIGGKLIPNASMCPLCIVVACRNREPFLLSILNIVTNAIFGLLYHSLLNRDFFLKKICLNLGSVDPSVRHTTHGIPSKLDV